MRILTYKGAKRFCESFSGRSKMASMRQMLGGIPNNKRVIEEGTPLYQEYCDNLLREADRSFVLGVSCFRRSLDLLTGAGSVWALVTLYYSNWFGARTILALHGAWIESAVRVEVRREQVAAQSFTINRRRDPRTHQRFWRSYYDGLRPYQQLVSAQFSSAVRPINNEKDWQIKLRNRINYDTQEAILLVKSFETRFKKESFPTSLPRELGTQFAVARSTLLLAAEEATRLGLLTDAFDPDFPSRKEALRCLVFDNRLPQLARHVERASLEI